MMPEQVVYVLQQSLNALQLGSIYALIALGYTMVYGVLTMINFAHGDVFMVGAFLCFAAAALAGLPRRGGLRRADRREGGGGPQRQDPGSNLPTLTGPITKEDIFPPLITGRDSSVEIRPQGNDSHPLKRSQGEYSFIPGNDPICVTGRGTFQDAVIGLVGENMD